MTPDLALHVQALVAVLKAGGALKTFTATADSVSAEYFPPSPTIVKHVQADDDVPPGLPGLEY